MLAEDVRVYLRATITEVATLEVQRIMRDEIRLMVAEEVKKYLSRFMLVLGTEK